MYRQHQLIDRRIIQIQNCHGSAIERNAPSVALNGVYRTERERSDQANTMVTV